MTSPLAHHGFSDIPAVRRRPRRSARESLFMTSPSAHPSFSEPVVTGRMKTLGTGVAVRVLAVSPLPASVMYQSCPGLGSITKA